MSLLPRPETDPTPIFELFRGNYASQLLTAAVSHFNVFDKLAEQPRTIDELGAQLELAERPTVVLITALRAMGLLRCNVNGKLELTRLAAEHLVPGGEFDVGNYIGLAATSPGVLEMVQRLRTNQPAGLDEDGKGAAFIYREGIASAMEEKNLARHFTLALAGRAKNVAPVLAEQLPMDKVGTLLDVGGGTGVYSIALLRKHQGIRAILLDRPEVLEVAEEFARQYGVIDRIELRPGDMFVDAIPPSDVVLLSNVLHDWDVPQCRELVQRCAANVKTGGRLLIHDVMLNDELDGPLEIALYSAALFTLTEGRAYSGKEFRTWLEGAGLRPQPPVETLVHCHVLAGLKS